MKKYSWNFHATDRTDCYFYPNYMSLSFSARRWVPEHASQNRRWSERGLGESEEQHALLWEVIVSRETSHYYYWVIFVINSRHSFHTGFLLRDFCSCVKLASWCWGQCKTIRGGGGEGGNAFKSCWRKKYCEVIIFSDNVSSDKSTLGLVSYASSICKDWFLHIFVKCDRLMQLGFWKKCAIYSM